MPLPAREGYEFGPYRIDADERLLYRGDELVVLPPKVAGTLIVLVQNAGRMVDKGDLMKAVWPDTFVEEGALTRNISLLRKALGDTGEEATYIETIPRRGYRFLAEVRPVGNGENGGDVGAPLPHGRGSVTGRKRWAAGMLIGLLASIAAIAAFANHTWRAPVAASITTSGKVLAVLPFRSIERDDSQDYFADGMTQAVITSLARLGKLRVVSLASEASGKRDAAAWSAILRDQSVHRVLSGTIRRSGDQVRIDAQLIDPSSRAVLWANSYERDMRNVFALESALAEAIAAEIQVSLTDEDRERLRERQVRPDALDAYLRGRYYWNRRTEDGLRRAVQYFQQAIALDSKYALAYSGLADSYALLGSIGTDAMPPNQAMPLAKSAAQKALELEPDLSDAHTSLAYVNLSYDWDLPAAAREFARALALNPNSATARHWYSHYFMAAGDMPKATEQMREALELEPLSPSINIGIGWCNYYSRQYDQAVDRFRSVTEMDPTLPLGHQTLGMAYQQKGQLNEAIEEYQRAAAFSANSPASVASLASAYAAAGRLPEARQELARLQEMSRTRYVPSFYFATVSYAMGDLTKTFEWGWKAVGERCDYLLYLRVEPRVGKLALNPEFMRGMASLHR